MTSHSHNAPEVLKEFKTSKAKLDNIQAEQDALNFALEQTRARHIERNTLVTWNIANLGPKRNNSSIVSDLLQLACYPMRKAKPIYYKHLLILKKQLTRDGIEIIYGRGYRTLPPSAINRIVSSPFWMAVVMPIEQLRPRQGLFDPEYYYMKNPDAVNQGLPALAHYIKFGAGEGRDPHPLFCTTWYLSQNPDISSTGVNPLFHFANWGGIEGRRPHPLFHSDWYLKQYPEVAVSGVNPLVDYLVFGADKGRNPNPFFDGDWYLTRYPEVAASGVNPLLHYLGSGAYRGRDPSPLFDSTLYLEEHPGVAAIGMNPLAHFVVFGPTAGVDTPPRSSVGKPAGKGGGSGVAAMQDPSRATFRLAEFTPSPARRAASGKPLIVCVSPAFPWPPQSGNEYRIARILSWLDSQGYEVLLVVAPPANDDSSQERRHANFNRYKNVIVCHRDGLIESSLNSLNLSFADIDGHPVAELFDVVKKKFSLTEGSSDDFERTVCNDAMIVLMSQIAAALPSALYYLHHAFMTRFLRYIMTKSTSIVDVVDMLPYKSGTESDCGPSELITIPEDDERRMLALADILVVTYGGRAQAFRRLVPDKPVIEAGVDFDLVEAGAPGSHANILVVATDSSVNVKGIRDFLRFAWPFIKRAVPAAQFTIVGRAGEAIRSRDPQVKIIGKVDVLDSLYRDARVVVNPVVAGTGLKIKTVESIAHFRPIVTWPAGIEGVARPLLRLCHVAKNWYDFAEHTILLLSSFEAPTAALAERDAIKRAFDADSAYGELGSWLQLHVESMNYSELKHAVD